MSDKLDLFIPVSISMIWTHVVGPSDVERMCNVYSGGYYGYWLCDLDLVQSLQDCFADVGLWMEENTLKLNDGQTEAIPFTTSSFTNTALQLPQTISLCNTDIKFSEITRILGFIFDSDLSLKPHIKTCRAAYSESRHISSIRQYLTADATKTLASSCILFRSDYCISLLAGYPQTLVKPLQQVQHSAAKLILKSRSSNRTLQTSS